MRLHLPACLLLLSFAGHAATPATDAVTIYRCVDAKGNVTLGDVPCAKGAQEQVRSMQRPQDGARPVVAPTFPAITPAAAPPQVVVLRTPQPMYECTTPDGDRYTSDDGEGNPRWVPLWTLGYGGGWRRTNGSATRALNAWNDDRPLGGRVGASTPRAPEPTGGTGRPDRPSRPGIGYDGAGTWVRDTCHALPQGEVCSRLTDRREELRRRFFNAQENERNVLRREERGINARLAADCGTR